MKHIKQLLIITIFLTNLTIAQQWQNVGTPGFSAGLADYPSFAIDGNGAPYIAYQDGINSHKATVMKYSKGSWINVGNPGFSAGYAIDLSLAIDINGTPYVAYQDVKNNYKATVMKYDGNNWVPVGNPGFSDGNAYFLSLAINGNGIPYVAYQDVENNYKATVMKYDGNNWVPVGNPGFSNGGVNYPSLAIANDGTAYVAYQDGGNNYRATVKKYNGSNWVNVGNVGFSKESVNYTSLAIDNDGTPYVAYRDIANSNKATVKKYNGSSWVNVGLAGFSAGDVSYTSLAIANDGTPCVAYKDIADSNKATVMSFGTSPLPVELTTFNAVINEKLRHIELNWQTATEVNNYGFEVERFVQNEDDNKWKKIAFIKGHGNSNSSKSYNYSDNTVSSGKFQYRLKQIDFDGKYSYSNIVEIDIGLPTEFSLKQNYPNPFNPSTVIEYSIPSNGMEQSNKVMLKVYDILGKEVATLINKKQSAGNYKIKFNANNLSNGVYFYQLTSGNYTATKKLMLMK